jgi:transposase-like protein
MAAISYKGYRFPPDVIQHSVLLYFRFTLSFRDVEEMLAWRRIDVTCETIRCWASKFGPLIAANLKRRRQSPSPRWHLDEMACPIKGDRSHLLQAVDDEGVILDLVV